MKRLRQTMSSLIRLAIGVCIVFFLIKGINKTSTTATFTIVPSSTASKDAVYADQQDATSATQISVLDATDTNTTLRSLITTKGKDPLSPSGTLYRVSGTGTDTIPYTAVEQHPHGMQQLQESFSVMSTNWPLALAGLLLFGVCLAICTVRWKLVLHAQGLELSWPKTINVFMIGTFFNAFLFGATGGDVVKSIYVARETGHKKTEAISTVFIDRVVGLVALVLLSVVTMLMNLTFFLATPITQLALWFMGSMFAAILVGFGVLFAMRRLLDRSAFFRRFVETKVGSILLRIYESFYICLARPAVFVRTLLLSLANHLCFLVVMYVLGRSLQIELRFIDYLLLAPTINALGSIPLTPGGLGVREYFTVVFLGAAGVAAVRALPLSLTIYATMLTWSLLGGVFFMFFGGRVKDADAGGEAPDEPASATPDPAHP